VVRKLKLPQQVNMDDEILNKMVRYSNKATKKSHLHSNQSRCTGNKKLIKVIN